MSTNVAPHSEPRIVPASKTLLIAVRQAHAMYQRTVNDILAAAVEDDPSLRGGNLDTDSGMWTLPPAPPS